MEFTIEKVPFGSIYLFAIFPTIQFYLPIIVIALVSCILCYSLFQASKSRVKMTFTSGSNSDASESVTSSVIAVSICFIICNTFERMTNIIQFLSRNTGKQYICSDLFGVLYGIGNLFLSFNSSVNFLLYSIFRHQFREKFLQIFRRSSKLETNRNHPNITEVANTKTKSSKK